MGNSRFPFAKGLTAPILSKWRSQALFAIKNPKHGKRSLDSSIANSPRVLTVGDETCRIRPPSGSVRVDCSMVNGSRLRPDEAPGGPADAGEEDRPLLDLRTVFGIPERIVNDEQDRHLLARAEAHLKWLDEEGLVKADPFHTMPAGGWHHTRLIERVPRTPYQYMVRLTWRGTRC